MARVDGTKAHRSVVLYLLGRAIGNIHQQTKIHEATTQSMILTFYLRASMETSEPLTFHLRNAATFQE